MGQTTGRAASALALAVRASADARGEVRGAVRMWCGGGAEAVLCSFDWLRPDARDSGSSAVRGPGSAVSFGRQCSRRCRAVGGVARSAVSCGRS
ncbi:hypothetical protein [Halorussus caseinilyticus]|uniref:Secreted protein n=1 Tax=Halorussus caseinilyticus TaxID=3034025 RepID=A0ABD5WJB2_9EURY